MSDRTTGRDLRDRHASHRQRGRGGDAASAPLESELQRRIDERTVDLEEMVGRLEEEISRRREIEERLRAREERLRLALDAGRMGTWDLDLATGLVLFDRRARVIIGRHEPHEMRVEDVIGSIHVEDRPSAEHALARALDPEGKGTFYAQSRIVQPDGGVRWIASRGRTLFRGNARTRAAMRMIGTIADITEQKRAELHHRFLAGASAALAESLDVDETLERVCTLATSALGDFAISYLLLGDVRSIRRVGFAHSDPRRRRLVERLRRFDIDISDATSPARVISTGETLYLPKVEEPFLRSASVDAEHHAVMRALQATSAVVVPLKARGKILGAFLVGTVAGGKPRLLEDDVAVLEELGTRAALAVENGQLYDQARRAVREREDVIAIVSHDLRNPLHTISMSLGLLGHPDLAPERREAQATLVRRAVKQMTRLIDDLLDSSTIGAGKLRVEPRAVQPRRLVTEAVEMGLTRLGGKDIELSADVSKNLPAVMADPGRVLQIFSNLIGNAIAVTPPGGRITVRAFTTDNGVTFEVADTGPGIAEEDQPHVFERFWKSGDNPNRGAGLGLTIAKGIAEAHGGRIWLTSEPGQGATFSFRIPCA